MSSYPLCSADKKNLAIWVKSLDLTADDRDDILKGRKLNDWVINAAQKVMKCQCGIYNCSHNEGTTECTHNHGSINVP